MKLYNIVAWNKALEDEPISFQAVANDMTSEKAKELLIECLVSDYCYEKDDIDRDTLEAIAKKTVSSELYYDLCDNLDAMSDDELQALIACNGNYKKEMKLGGK